MKYVVIPHFTKIEKRYVKTYAIVVINKFVPIKIIKDVWTDGKALQKFVARLNENQVELVHLYDAIEDFYFEQS